MTAEVTTDVGALLGEMAFHQILAVPRWPDSTDAEAGVSGARAHVRRSKDSDVIRSGVLVALAGAHSELSAIAVAWLRRAPVGSVGVAPVEVYVGGRQSFGRPSQSLDGEVSVLFPAGSRGKPVENRHVVDHLAVLPNWSRCLGTYDSHVVAAEDSPSGQYRAPFEDYITSVPSKTFAWLVVAEPIPRDTLEQRLPALQERLYDLKGMEHDRFKVERAEAEYRNLLRARATGIWRVHVLVGTPTLGETRSLAALFCAGSDLARQPYMLLPDTTTGSFQDVARCTSTEGEDFASPFEGTTDLLATIARPPEQEIPGVRALNLPAFDLTPETPATGIHLGEALDANGEAAGAVYVTTGTLNRHAFVCGATGSGKSQTVRSILEELSVAGIPWLVIEPAKAEYARMAGRLAERAKPEYRPITGQVARSRSAVHLIRPGDTTVAPASLNPLEPEPGFPLQTHVDLVRALFLAAFEAEEPFPQVLAAALTRCYTDLGWDLALGRSRRRSIVPRFPTLEDLQRTSKLVVAGIGYGPE